MNLVHWNSLHTKKVILCFFKETLAKPGAALQTPPCFIKSALVCENFFTPPPCPNVADGAFSHKIDYVTNF